MTERKDNLLKNLLEGHPIDEENLRGRVVRPARPDRNPPPEEENDGLVVEVDDQAADIPEADQDEGEHVAHGARVNVLGTLDEHNVQVDNAQLVAGEQKLLIDDKPEKPSGSGVEVPYDEVAGTSGSKSSPDKDADKESVQSKILTAADQPSSSPGPSVSQAASSSQLASNISGYLINPQQGEKKRTLSEEKKDETDHADEKKPKNI